MPYIPIPPPIRKQNPTMKISNEQKEYLKELGEWLDGIGDEELGNGIVRDTAFFKDLIRKVEVIEGYDKVDREWLTKITGAHTEWKRNR
jgi:hypothetical protein